MIKPFGAKGSPARSTSCSHNKNAMIYGMTNAYRGRLNDYNREL